jgi:actin-related protein 5
MMELLFENYTVPSINFSIDSLLSYGKNSDKENGLIIKSGFNSSYILPILNGKIEINHLKRVPIGNYFNFKKKIKKR